MPGQISIPIPGFLDLDSSIPGISIQHSKKGQKSTAERFLVAYRDGYWICGILGGYVGRGRRCASDSTRGSRREEAGRQGNVSVVSWLLFGLFVCHNVVIVFIFQAG
jgi:hypothetical protein